MTKLGLFSETHPGIVGPAAAMAWCVAGIMAMHGGRTADMIIALFFAVGTVAVLAQREYPNRAEVLSASLLGPVVLVGGTLLSSLIQRVTTSDGTYVPPGLMLIRLTTQGLLAAMFLAWLFRFGWPLLVGITTALSPSAWRRRVCALAEEYPLDWWWKAPALVAALYLGIAVASCTVLLIAHR